MPPTLDKLVAVLVIVLVNFACNVNLNEIDARILPKVVVQRIAELSQDNENNGRTLDDPPELGDDEAVDVSAADNDNDVWKTLRPGKAFDGQPLPPHFELSKDKNQDPNQLPRPSIYSSNEYNLYSALLLKSNYSKNVRPVRNHLDPIIVKVGMCVMMIEDLIERDQTMVMSACVKMFWVDEYLRWDPQQYGNLSWLALGSQSIWLPDIAIVNSPEPHALTRKATNIGVSFRGEVGFFPSGRLATRCNLIITYFPFDWQNCEVRFESWIYPTKYLIVELYPGEEAIDVKEYYDNFQWSLKSYRVETDVVNYDGKNFSSLTVVFRLRRKPAFYFMYFIFPQLLLAALQTLSHTLPVEHPGRMAMLTALFIGTSVTHSGIASHIPKSSDTMSLLQWYMTIMSVNLVLALLITFVMLYTVLRYPKCEPSFMDMMIAFFSIVWPGGFGSDNGDSALLYEINRHFGKKPSKKKRADGRFSKTAGGSVRKRNKTVGKLKLSHEDETSSSLLTWPHQPMSSESSSLLELADRLENESGGNSCDDLIEEEDEQESTLDSQNLDDQQQQQLQHQDGTIWIPNPDYLQEPGRPMIQINGVAYCGHSSPSNATPDYDCAYFRPRSSEEILPVIATNHYSKYPTYGEALFYDNPAAGFSYSKSSCDSCQNQRSAAVNYGTIVNSPKLKRRGMMNHHQNSGSYYEPNGHYHQRSRNYSKNGRTSRKLNKYRHHHSEIEEDDLSSNNHSSSVFKSITTGRYMNPYSSGGGGHSKKRNMSMANSSRRESYAVIGSTGISNDDSELKRRWLMYCVALDKSIMYVNGFFNVIVPVVLFVCLPGLHDFSHGDALEV